VKTFKYAILFAFLAAFYDNSLYSMGYAHSAFNQCKNLFAKPAISNLVKPFTYAAAQLNANKKHAAIFGLAAGTTTLAYKKQIFHHIFSGIIKGAINIIDYPINLYNCLAFETGRRAVQPMVYRATNNGWYKTLRFLLKHGANPEFVYHDSNSIDEIYNLPNIISPIEIATIKNDHQALRILHDNQHRIGEHNA